MSPERTPELLANLRVALDTAVHRVNQFKGLGLLALEAAITGEMDDSAPMILRLDERAFDATGDPVEGPMTIFRFTRGNFVVDRVVRVRLPSASR